MRASQEDLGEPHFSEPCTIARTCGWRAMSHQGVNGYMYGGIYAKDRYMEEKRA